MADPAKQAQILINCAINLSLNEKIGLDDETRAGMALKLGREAEKLDPLILHRQMFVLDDTV